MKRNAIAAVAVFLVAILALAGCKSMGSAVTSRGQIFNIDVKAPKDLPEGAEDNIDVVFSNFGVNKINNIVADVEIPPQLVVLDQTNDRGLTVTHVPGSNVYHFSIPDLSPTDDAHARFHVRTAFGTMTETGQISVTAWAEDLPDNKLFKKTTIALRR